jgi:glucose-6-phosphate 1-dehydrogenase
MKGEPISLVVLGVTGDLMARKLSPALLSLFTKGKLPKNFNIVGFSRRDWKDETLREHIKTQLSKHSREVPASQVNKFLKLLSYQHGNFDDPRSYKELEQHLKKIEAGRSTKTNRLFYLAVPPELYSSIIRRLAKSSLMKQLNGRWARLIIEKPFGRDLEHAMEVDELLNELFEEDQIYRIDHYLAKEAVQNILTFRFANNFMSSSLGKHNVERIDVKLWETIDIEGRGEFYDAYGALLDVGQNHLLQMLALVTMEKPLELSAELIRAGRAEIISHIAKIKDVKRDTRRAQYRGYRNEKEVDSKSRTETFFKIRSSIDLPAWRGVPMYLEGGKKLPVVDKQIIITFRHPRPCLCPPGMHYKNQLFIRIQPNPGIKIRFWAKKPGTKAELEEQSFSFAYPMGETARYKEEYAQLLSDVLAGDLTLFVSGAEAIASWHFIDPIVRAWRKDKNALPTYHDDQTITKIAQELEQPAYRESRHIGLVGLGKMGLNMALRLQEQGWQITALTRRTEDSRLEVLHDVKKFVAGLPPPRLVWLMVPAGTVDEVLFGKNGLLKMLKSGDTIIDGGNSYFVDTKRRAKKVTGAGVRFMDAGVSGGPSGARGGASVMVGGRQEDLEQLEELFAAIAAPGAYQFFEGYGAGHFVKMVHNGIEYGMMQALAEGFTILKKSDYQLDLSKVTEIYNNGSVIESRLVGWLQSGLKVFGEDLKGVSGSVGHTGEGEWTVKTAEAMKLKADIIAGALEFRKKSANSPSYTGQVLSALRNQFGGHSLK